MANILQVTPPEIRPSQETPSAQEVQKQAEGPAVRNPADPSKIVRADGQGAEKTDEKSQEAGVVSYESNYGAFLRELSENRQSSELLKQLLFRLMEPGSFLTEGNHDLASLFAVKDGAEAASLLSRQAAAEKIFSGSFFDLLRRFLQGDQDQTAGKAGFAFLKAYGDFSAGPHLLRQMETIAKDIEFLLLPQFREEWKGLLDMVNWNAPRGETGANQETVNSLLIPFLASYISKTHDYGAVRNAAMLFIMYAVNYENGSSEHLEQVFQRLARQMEDGGWLIREPAAALEQLKGQPAAAEQSGQTAASLAEAIGREVLGQGTEGAAQIQELLKGLLNNESVYMPLLHLVFPFSMEEKQVASELWINPDAPKQEGEEGRKIRLLANFEIRELGSFQMILTIQDRQADMSLFVPRILLDRKKEIETDLSGILKENGFRPGRVSAGEGMGQLHPLEIFPEIREKARTMNVTV